MLDDSRRTVLHPDEPVHQGRRAEIRPVQRRTGILAHEFRRRRAGYHGQSARPHLLHAALENPPQPQRHRFGRHALSVLRRHAPAVGDGGNPQLHVIDFSGRLFLPDFQGTHRALHAGGIGTRFRRRGAAAEPFFRQRAGNRRWPAWRAAQCRAGLICRCANYHCWANRAGAWCSTFP